MPAATTGSGSRITSHVGASRRNSRAKRSSSRLSYRRGALEGRSRSLWRYAEVLPDAGREEDISLGEGGTPLLSFPALARRAGVRALLVKEEGLESRFARHARAAGRLRSGLADLGFAPIAPAGLVSNTVTCVTPPDGVEAIRYSVSPEADPVAIWILWSTKRGARS